MSNIELRLRGKGLPAMDSWMQGYIVSCAVDISKSYWRFDAGGKSDPYFLIHRGFGEGFQLPSERYEGSPRAKALYKSEIVYKCLDPEWKSCTLDLARLCQFFMIRYLPSLLVR